MSTRQLLGRFAFLGAFLANDVRRLFIGHVYVWIRSTAQSLEPHPLCEDILFYFAGAYIVK